MSETQTCLRRATRVKQRLDPFISQKGQSRDSGSPQNSTYIWSFLLCRFLFQIIAMVMGHRNDHVKG
jgi:hypothetical protein